MVLRCATFMVVLMFLMTTVAFGANALMGRCDPQQTSYTAEKLDPPLKLLWEYTANKYRNNSAAPLVSGGISYFSCGDRVYAVNMDTGTWKWTYPADQGLGGSVKGTPLLSDGKLYFGAGDGNFYCINAETGAYEWHYQTRGAIRCPPVISEGIVYFGADDNCLYAVHADSGDAAWTKPFLARDDFATGVAVGNGMVVAACMDAVVYGVSAPTGRLKWMFRLGMAPTCTSPVISENMAIVAVGNTMHGISVRSGQLRWSIGLPAEVAATPAVDGGDIYVPCKDRKIYAYTTTGRQIALKWSTPADMNSLSKDQQKPTAKSKDIGGIPMASPVIADKMLYVTASRGVIAGFSTTDGSMKWRYQVLPSAVTMPGSPSVDIACSPTVANGSLMVLSDDGVLHCFNQVAGDHEAPEVYNMAPTNAAAMSGAPPIRMAATVYDIGSGADFTSASMTLDGNPVEYSIDLSTSTIYYQTEISSGGKPVRALTDGLHNIVLTVKDYAGNLATASWFFIADKTLPPPKRTTTDPEWGNGKTSKEPPKKFRPNSLPIQPSGPDQMGPPGPPTGGEYGPPQDDGGRHHRGHGGDQGDNGEDVPGPPGMP